MLLEFCEATLLLLPLIVTADIGTGTGAAASAGGGFRGASGSSIVAYADDIQGPRQGVESVFSHLCAALLPLRLRVN